MATEPKRARRVDHALVKPIRCACGASFAFYAGWVKHINFEGEHEQVK